jgi:hypothetical protein
MTKMPEQWVAVFLENDLQVMNVMQNCGHYIFEQQNKDVVGETKFWRYVPNGKNYGILFSRIMSLSGGVLTEEDVAFIASETVGSLDASGIPNKSKEWNKEPIQHEPTNVTWEKMRAAYEITNKILYDLTIAPTSEADFDPFIRYHYVFRAVKKPFECSAEWICSLISDVSDLLDSVNEQKMVEGIDAITDQNGKVIAAARMKLNSNGVSVYPVGNYGVRVSGMEVVYNRLAFDSFTLAQKKECVAWMVRSLKCAMADRECGGLLGRK